MYNYTVIDLGELMSGGGCSPVRINAAGQVTGSAPVPGDYVSDAFLSSIKGGQPLVDLGFLNGDIDSTGSDINAPGDVIGWSTDDDAIAHVVRWSGGKVIDLHDTYLRFQKTQTPDGEGTFNDSMGLGINDVGDVVGTARFTTMAGGTNSSTGKAGWVLYRNGEFHNLTTEVDPRIDAAVAINDSGQIVGTLGTAGSFIYSAADGFQQIEGLGRSQVTSINAAGVVAGWNSDGLFTWEAGQAINLFWPGTAGAANDINALGVVVGSADYPFIYYPFTYEGFNAPINLNDWLLDADWSVLGVSGINDKGWMTGAGSHAGGPPRGIVLVPTLRPARITLEIAAQILFVAMTDAGGHEVVGGHRVPVPGWGLTQMPAAQRDLLLGLGISELASLIQDPASRSAIRSAAAQLIQGATSRLTGAPTLTPPVRGSR